MAELSNDPDVENVLSAIRRLIVEGRPEASASVPLILTSSQRVEKEPPPKSPDLPHDDPAPLAPSSADAPVTRPATGSDVYDDGGGALQVEATPLATADPPPALPAIAAEPEAAPPSLSPSLDEAALRALIAEVLREELGERLRQIVSSVIREELSVALISRRDA